MRWIPRNSPVSERTGTQGSSPEGVKRIAHGVSRGKETGDIPAPERGVRSFRQPSSAPFRGWKESKTLPTADAVGYCLSLLRSLVGAQLFDVNPLLCRAPHFGPEAA